MTVYIKKILVFLLMWFISTACLGAAGEHYFGITSFSAGHYGAQKHNWSFIQDDRGVLFTANSGGVLEYDSLDWRLIPVPGTGAFALAKDDGGKIYVGGNGEIGYLGAKKDGSLVYRSLKNRLPKKYRNIKDRVVQIQAVPGGVAFLLERLLVVLTEGGVETYTTADHFFSLIYRAGSIYVIDGIRGLLRAGGGALTPVSGGELLRAYVMLPYGEDDILIVTTHEGPLIFDPAAPGNPYRPFLKNKNDYFLDNIVTCGAMLRSGHVMLGSLEKGIAIFPAGGGEPVLIGPDMGLPDNIIYGLFQDAEGNTWVGMDNGISLLRSPFFVTGTQTQTPGAAKGGRMRLRSRTIPFAALIRGCRRFADDGQIFRGAFFGQQSRVQQSEQQEHQVGSFAYAYNGFRFSFSSNCFEESGKILYQCKMEGQDPVWSNWSDRTVREYTNLHWGKYTLRVRAKNAFGEISREARFSFIVNPPWHETWWFLTSQITFIFLVLIASRLMDRIGRAPKMSQYMIVFAVIIIFEYFNGFIGPYIGRYSNNIAFFGMIMTAVLSIVIGPAEDFILGLMKKIIKGK